jgi:hypothetical protein
MYETCMMVSEYFQNILLNKSSNNNILILLNHGMYFCHIMLWKIYNLWPKQKKDIKKFKTCYMMMACQSTSYYLGTS